MNLKVSQPTQIAPREWHLTFSEVEAMSIFGKLGHRICKREGMPTIMMITGILDEDNHKKLMELCVKSSDILDNIFGLLGSEAWRLGPTHSAKDREAIVADLAKTLAKIDPTKLEDLL